MNSKFYYAVNALTIVGAMAALGAGAAFGQQTQQTRRADQPTATDSGSLSEVVVTARRRAEKLQDVPVAITVMTNETLQEQHVVRSTDLAQIAPSLASTPTNRGANSSDFEIRGVRGPNTETLLLDPAVAVYFGQVNQSRSVGTNNTMYDLDSVQVLKGPQGTLFGRNSTGGAILIEPKKPSAEFEGYGEVSLGDYNYHDFEGMLNIPINDKLSVRAAGKISQRDGYLHYIGTGQNADDLDTQSARLSVRFQPTDAIDSTLMATFFHGGGGGEGFKMTGFNPLGVLAGFGPARPIWISMLQQQLAANQALPKYEAYETVFQGVYDRNRSIQDNTTIDLGAYGFLGDLTLVNIIGYKDILDRQNGAGASGVGVPVYEYDNTNITASQFSEELQLQGKTENLDYVAGIFYFDESGTDQFTTYQFGAFASPQFQSQLLATAGPATTAALDAAFPARGLNKIGVFNDSYAAFVHGNYKLSSILEGLSLSGGLRVSNDDREVNWHNMTTGGIVPTKFVCTVTGAVYTFADYTSCAFGGHLASVVPTYDMTLDYKVNQDLLLYVTSRYGYRSGGFSTVTPVVNSLTNASFGPEYNRDVEIGSKADFDVAGVRGRLNVAVFHTWYSQVQQTISFINSSNTTSAYTANAAEQHIDGGEIEMLVKPNDAIELSGSIGRIYPKFDQWSDLIKVGAAFVPIDLTDSRDAYLPYTTYSVSAQYRLPLPQEMGDAAVRLTYSGQSSSGTTNPDTTNCGPAVAPGASPLYLACLDAAGRLPGYGILKLRADWYNVANRGFDLSFFVDNLTNEFYGNFAFNTLGNAFGSFEQNVGAPRMFGFQMRVPFGALSY